MTASNHVGVKIARLRQMKNIGIEELATRSSLSAEQIQSIEEGKLMPSLSPLIKIARALSVRLGTFLDDQEQLGPVVSRSNEAALSASFSNNNTKARSHLDFFALASGKSGRHMEPFIIDINPSTVAEHITSSHEGEEFIYVLEGTVEIAYGKETYVLNAGDSIYYDSFVEHHVHAPSQQTAKILAVVYTPV
jgi:transcriptional regulator with XRE-family HTH domain